MAEFDPMALFGQQPQRPAAPSREMMLAAILEMLADLLREDEEEEEPRGKLMPPEKPEPIPVVLPFTPSGGM